MSKRGISLLEVVILISIIGIIAAIIIPGLSGYRASQAVKKDTELVTEVLRKARAQTLSSKDSSAYGVHLASSTVTLFKGSVYTVSDPSNLQYDLSASTVISALSLVGGGTDIVFTRLTGETAQHGTITLSSSATTVTKTITLYKTGLVEIN